MNEFEKQLVSQYGQADLDKIQKVQVGIAGCGGLGSNCAFNLVRSGFKNFIIVDFDVIEYSNLNRQFYFYDQVGTEKAEALKHNLLKINPNINIKAIVKKLESDNIEETFKDCDIIVEAFDKAEYKSMIASKFMGKDKLFVSGSGMVGIGNSDDIKVNRIKDKFIVIGDMTSDSKDSFPVSPRVNIAAAKQADVILEYVLK